MINWKQRYAIAPHADYDRMEYKTPREIISNYEVNMGELSDSPDPENFWQQKLKESKESGLHDDIKKNGLSKPIAVIEYKGGGDGNVADKEIFEGHHRLISSLEIASDKPIPVKILTDNPYFYPRSTYNNGDL